MRHVQAGQDEKRCSTFSDAPCSHHSQCFCRKWCKLTWNCKWMSKQAKAAAEAAKEKT